MGSLQAAEFASQVEEGAISLEAALHWHLTANHYPPIHPVFIKTAAEAIDYASIGAWDEPLELPNGLVRTVHFVVEGLHLWSFLPSEDDDALA